MTNFIFKSASDLQKIRQQLETVLNNQRHLRIDIEKMFIYFKQMKHDMDLQTQVDKFFPDENVIHPEDQRDLD